MFTRAAQVAALVLLYAGASTVHDVLGQTRARWPRLEERIVVPAPRLARIQALGYSEVAADWYWAKLLVYYGDGLSKGWSLKDVEPLLEVVNALDPFFRKAYIWGAHAVVFRQTEATQDEFRASIEVLDRGLKVFPNDWELNWYLGLRHFLDLKAEDPVEQRRFRETGAAYIEKAMRCPNGPPDLPILAAAMRTELGQKDRALQELKEMILTVDDEKARARLAARYRALAGKTSAVVEEAAQAFRTEWQAALPYAPDLLYVLLGPRPSPAIDLAGLAERDWFEFPADVN